VFTVTTDTAHLRLTVDKIGCDSKKNALAGALFIHKTVLLETGEVMR
jgi:hypothetical protein